MAVSGLARWLGLVRRRVGRFSLRASSPFLLIGALIFVGITSVLLLQRYADGRRETEGLLERVQSQVNALSQAEARSLAQGRVSKKLKGQADAARLELNGLVAALPRRAGNDGSARAVVEAASAYLGRVDEEFGLLGEGRPGDARRVQDTAVDPSFDRLQVAINEAVARHRDVAGRAEWLAAIGSVAAMLLAAGAVGFLGWRMERTRRDTVVAAAEQATLGRSGRLYT